MALDFTKFKHAVSARFEKMSKDHLFCTGVSKDDLWDKYLASFPEGTNPLFRERTEHDCSCCRSFIRTVGNLVSIVNGKAESLWDIRVDDPAYQAVADAMSAFVKSKPIGDFFLHTEQNAGTDQNYEQIGERTVTWKHFHVRIPHRANSGPSFVRAGKDIATELGDRRTKHDVMLRGLTELTMEAVDTVLEVIAQGSLYRGAEQKFMVDAFKKVKKEFDKLPADKRDNYVWLAITKHPDSVSMIRNTSIGTLLIDLSADMDLEEAVGRYEVKMDARNYKRSSALVTQSMVNKAKEKITELGLATALERRYARLSDVSVNDILFRDRPATVAMRGADPFAGIANKPVVAKAMSKVETVGIEQFITDILPKVDSVEVLFENRHAGSLVSLIAPAEDTSRLLFNWENNFSWTYNGDVTDSIKERVKKAGGNVTGDLCCRLSWFNYDDLDFHMKEPGGNEIMFNNRRSATTGGQLDVDMNAGSGDTRTPVENIFYENRSRMREGTYRLFVYNFSKRETTDVGFEAEIDYLGETTRFAYEKAVGDRSTVKIATMEYTHKGGLQIVESLPSSSVRKTLWGISTQEFHRVNVLMRSPNHWGDKRVGNEHYFFMLEGCANAEPARGFYNEFLRPDLNPHRKVFEMVGARMKTKESAEQLSGIGFSSTKRNEVTVRVKGNFARTLNVMI